jgi:hypothetical protein
VNEDQLNIEIAKTIRAVVWAVAAVLCTLIGATNAYYTVRDSNAIKSGLAQSVSYSTMGGYWTKPRTEQDQ